MRRHAVRDAVSLSVVCVAILLTLSGEAQEYTFTRFAGTTGGAGSIDANGVDARFNEPWAIVAAPDGSLYVAASGSNTIRHISPSGEVSTVAGLAGFDGAFDGVGHAAQLGLPRSLALDSSGNLYVGEWGTSVIRKITPAGAVADFVGRAYSHGITNGPASVATFNHPAGLAFDSVGNLYVADQLNHVIRKVTATGSVSTFAGTAGVEGYQDGTGTAARFRRPSGLGFGPTGILYVADTGNHVIRQISTTGAVSLVAGLSGVRGDVNGSGTIARFDSPEGLAVASDGTIYVADTANSKIRVIFSSGTVSTFAGSGTVGNADGMSSGARFDRPSGITIGTTGIYVADRGAHVVRRIADDFTTTYAGAAPLFGLVNGASASARFQLPAGVATDGAGNLYVADWGNSVIRKVASNGSVSTAAGDGFASHADGPALDARFQSPTALTVHGSNVYVADKWVGHTIRKLDLTAGVVSTVAGTSGSPGDEDGPGGTARFNEPSDVATDADGNVYVTDSDNHTIRKIATDGTVSTFAGFPGASGTDDGTGGAARFNEPYAIARVGSNLFVADRQNHAIRKVTLTSGAVTTFAGTTGVSGFEDGTGSAAGFRFPEGIGADASDNLYVTESGAFTIRKITPAGVVTTIGGLTQRNGSEEGTGSVARFTWPVGIDGDSAGNIYVADVYGQRIWKGAPAHAANATIDSATGPLFVPRQLGSSAAASSYQWSLIRRPNGSTATLSNPSDDNPTFTPDVPDRYTFRLDASTGSSRSITLVDFDAQCAVNVDTVVIERPVVGVPYSEALAASGGTGPYIFGLTGSYMPPGLALSPEGMISGTPTERGTTNITVVAMDANGCQGTRALAIDVAPLPAPSSLVATAGGSGVTLTWNGVATASAYEVYRETPGAGWSLVATPADTPYTDTDAPVNTTVLYWVQALDADGYRSPESNRDLATTVEFTDSLAAPVMIKAVHIEQLRHAVHEARRLGGLAAYPWTNPGALVGMSVKAAHITQLRTALNEARTALGISALTFADPSLSGVTAKKIHITQLRVGVR